MLSIAIIAVQCALETLADSALVPVDGLVLISAEIGIAKIAAILMWCCSAAFYSPLLPWIFSKNSAEITECRPAAIS